MLHVGSNKVRLGAIKTARHSVTTYGASSALLFVCLRLFASVSVSLTSTLTLRTAGRSVQTSDLAARSVLVLFNATFVSVSYCIHLYVCLSLYLYQCDSLSGSLCLSTCLCMSYPISGISTSSSPSPLLLSQYTSLLFV